MSDQNLTDNTRPARICGSPDCTTCPTVAIFSPVGRSLSGMTASGSIVAPAGLAGFFTTSTLREAVAEPQLTVKQAAKAYRKAVKAAEAAEERLEHALRALELDQAAFDDARKALSEAKHDLEKAARS